MQRVNEVVRLSHRAGRRPFIGSLSHRMKDRTQRRRRNRHTQEISMSNVRSLIVSITILASFLLVLAAPFRWF